MQTMEDTETITLNVGGRIFCTYYQTLKASIYIHDLLEAKEDNSACFLENGDLFIDRDPDVFEIVLDYLRTLDLLSSDYSLEVLQSEANFYQIRGLQERIRLSMKTRDAMKTDNRKFFAISQNNECNNCENAYGGYRAAMPFLQKPLQIMINYSVRNSSYESDGTVKKSVVCIDKK